jgi:hypothetical protein
MDGVTTMRPIVPAICASLSAAACVPASATVPPNHLSATAEEAIARRQERAAGVLERQGSMADDTPECSTPPRVGRRGVPGMTCGPSTRPPGETDEDNVRAGQLRDSAARHRRVAMALETAEWRACEGLSEDEIARSPFTHRDDVVDVEVVSGAAGPDGRPRVAGARVRFHQIGVLGADRLQHVVDCHLTIDNELGDDVPEKSYSPLVPRGATATVTAVAHGYVIQVLSDDPDGAREIVRRALALRPVAR